jgi:hypothetical protein
MISAAIAALAPLMPPAGGQRPRKRSDWTGSTQKRADGVAI